MPRRDDLARRVSGLRRRAEELARHKLDNDSLEVLKRASGAGDAARRRLERLRAGNDVAYAERLIERAIRRGREEQADALTGDAR